MWGLRAIGDEAAEGPAALAADEAAARSAIAAADGNSLLTNLLRDEPTPFPEYWCTHDATIGRRRISTINQREYRNS